MTEHYKGLEESYSSMPDRDYSTGSAKLTAGRMNSKTPNVTSGPRSVSDIQGVSERLAGMVESASTLLRRQESFLERVYGPAPEEGVGGKAIPIESGQFAHVLLGLSLLEDLIDKLHQKQNTIERLA